MLSLEELFCAVDDFCKTFEPQWKQQLLGSGLQFRNRPLSLHLSEIMTILIAFHQSCYRNFKTYYHEKVQTEWAEAFSRLVSYQRFIDWVPGTLVPMCAYLRSLRRSEAVRVSASVAASVLWTRPRSKSATTVELDNIKCFVRMLTFY